MGVVERGLRAGVVERGLRASELLADGDEHSCVPETGRCHPRAQDPRGQRAGGPRAELHLQELSPS